MANPSTRWDFVPVYGVYHHVDETPITGTVSFTFASRVTRVDGRIIYAEGAVVSKEIGNLSDQDSEVRETVRAAWRAQDQALAVAAGQTFDGTAWDVWWTDVVVPAAIFTRFPALDDPDITTVTNGAVSVREQLDGGGGKSYSITPLLSHLALSIPGINLGLIEVPPNSPNVPAPMYAKGVPGGVASLDNAGKVPAEQIPAGIGGGGGVSSWNDLTDKPSTFPPTIGSTGTTAVAGNDARLTDERAPLDGSVTNAKVSGSAAISLDKTVDTGTRVAMTPNERTKLSDLPTAASLTTSLAGKAASTHGHAISDVTGLQTALDGKQASGSYAAASHTHPAADIATTLGISQLPTGTSGTTVALGNHTHTAAAIGAATATHTHAIADVTNLQATLDGKAASSHTHTASQISDSTATGRSVLTAADAAAARTAIGAGTSNLALGSTSSTAAAGDHTHAGYAPTSHTHAIADTTGLQTALDGKAPVSHTHTAAQISDSTAIGRSLVTAADAAAVRTAADAAQTSHTHAASAVTSGTLDIARIPTGTSGTTVALGNHTHSATAITSGLLDIARSPANLAMITTGTTRPSSRTDMICIFMGADPGANALENDIWLEP